MSLVSITIVRDDSYAGHIGLKAQDLIYRINGQPVTSAHQVTDSIAAGPARFEIIRGDQLLEFAIDSPTLGVVLGGTPFDETAWRARKQIADVLLATGPDLPGRTITRTIGLVGAQCVYGVDVFGDMAAGIRGLVGGRSEGLQSRLAEARGEVCSELRAEAARLGATAVVAVRIEHNQIGDKGGFMLMVTATGTAVVHH